MQVNIYGTIPAQPQQHTARVAIQAPGYVSTSSWNHLADEATAAGRQQKGRTQTPPPSVAMGLHRLTLEAFWLD